MADDIKPLSDAGHASVLREKVLGARSYTEVVGGQDRPTAIILSGQPGAGKGNLTATAKAEFNGNIAVVDPDTLRDAHPSVGVLRSDHPYTWADHTHPDASQWAKELRADAIAQRKHLVIDSTMPKVELIRELQAKGYQVEVRAVAAHRFESELGVDQRFGKGIEQAGYGRYVPQDLRKEVYDKLPGTLDDVARQTGVPIQIYDREGRLHYDSRTSPSASPGRALETARVGRLTQDRLNDLHQSTDIQRQWHRDLPERVPNERVGPDTARHLLDERQAARVDEGFQRLHNEVGGYRAVRPTIQAAGVLGTAYGAYDAKVQVEAAIDTARSHREQWVRGGKETANQTVKATVTGTAATVGAIPGAAVGALTSPATGPGGPVVGGLVTGGASAYGAEKLYEDSRLQQFSKYLGGKGGALGYDLISREGRLLRQVNGLTEDLQHTTHPAERARLQTRLEAANTAFGREAERNGRYFEGRAGIDKAWEAMHTRFRKVDKDEVNDALARHIDAGKKPLDAVRGAYSDAVHKRYPRALPHEPLEDYRALSSEQLEQKHRHYAGEVNQGRAEVKALAAIEDSRNTHDQGWPRELTEKRHAARVQDALDEVWRDSGHLKAIREVYQARGIQPPALSHGPRRPAPTPAETFAPAASARDAFGQQANLGRSCEGAGAATHRDNTDALFNRLTDAAMARDTEGMRAASQTWRASAEGQQWLQTGQAHNQAERTLEAIERETERQAEQGTAVSQATVEHRAPAMRM